MRTLSMARWPRAGVTLLSLVVVAALAVASPAWAAEITVNATEDEFNTDGDCALREAILSVNFNAAWDGCAPGSATERDTIVLGAGTYPLNINETAPNNEFVGDLDIRGDTTVRGEGKNSTRIQGQVGFNDRIFENSGTGKNLTLRDIAVSGGNTTIGGGLLEDGGGVRISGRSGGTVPSTLNVDNASIDNNAAGNGGGVSIDAGARADIVDSSVSNNTALSNGGGIDNGRSTSSAVTITASSIVNNLADNGSGGGIFNVQGSVTVGAGTDVASNSADSGGGILNGATLDVTRSTVSDNRADGNTDADGGGILSAGSTSETTVTNSTISGNALIGPAATKLGGGIYNAIGTIRLLNATITNNTASDGSGAGIASSGAGGIFAVSTSIKSSIVSGNNGTNVDTVNSGTSSFASEGFNLIGAGNATASFDQPGDQTSVSNPGLGPLAINGGFTATHALLAGSSAVDAGNTDLDAPPNVDQRGEDRNLDDPTLANAPGSDGSDIGAFEKRAPVISINDRTLDEGNTGTTDATFTVTLSEPADRNITLNYATSDGTATAGSDYTATSGSLTIPTGQTGGPIPVPIVGDGRDEPNETFTVTLSGAAGVMVDAGTGTITDDDATPPAPTIGSPPNNSYDRDGSFTVAGTAQRGTTVKLYEGAALRGTAAASASTGAWSISLTGVPDGRHVYAATATDAAGNVSPRSVPRAIAVDKTRPRVMTVTPAAGATGVAPAANLAVVFSEAINAATLNASTVKLVKAGTNVPVAARVSYDPARRKVILDPRANLAAGARYAATVTTGAKDLAGNPLAAAKTWSFIVRR